jgi:hypothetical protein
MDLNLDPYMSVKEAFDLVERQVKNKKEAVDQAEVELDLLKQRAYMTYKQKCDYILFYILDFNGAQRWLNMIMQGCDTEGRKLDRRRKYPEESSFQMVQSKLRQLLNQPTLEVVCLVAHNFTTGGWSINFTLDDHKYSIHIPLPNKITYETYKERGRSAFELTIFNADTSNVRTWAGSTLFVDELPQVMEQAISRASETQE